MALSGDWLGRGSLVSRGGAGGSITRAPSHHELGTENVQTLPREKATEKAPRSERHTFRSQIPNRLYNTGTWIAQATHPCPRTVPQSSQGRPIKRIRMSCSYKHRKPFNNVTKTISRILKNAYPVLIRRYPRKLQDGHRAHVLHTATEVGTQAWQALRKLATCRNAQQALFNKLI